MQTMSLPRTQSERTYTYDHEKYYESRNKFVKSSNGIYKSMAVASDSECSSKVGKSILDKGGSVVDASIASLLCNGVLNAQSMGIGGGLFMLHYDRQNEKMTVIDARETAPQNSDMNMFKSSSKTKGGLSIAVPGEIKGYWQAHQMFGKLKWSELFQPAIEMCNNGFCMPQSQARILKYCESKIMSCDALRETFLNKITNDLYKANNIVKRPKLAKTLEIIAKEGESAFYNGSLTETIVDEVQSGGGIINKHDLNMYKCEIKEPISHKLRNNVELFTIPSPSCGVLLNFILGILDSFDHDIFSIDFDQTNTLFYHRFIEACKLGFGLRNLVGDENFYDQSHLYKTLTDLNVINEYKQKINEHRVFGMDYYGSSNFVSDSGTAHISLVGPNGDAVAATSSINLVFGSKIMGDKTNIIYNNQMDDFAAPNAEFNSFSLPNFSINYIEPYKRPVSSMTPLIALNENKDVRMVCGSSGGTRIISSTALTVCRNMLLRQDIVKSVDEARLHSQLCPDEVLFENHFDPKILVSLANKGHKIVDFGFGGSAVQAIERLSDGKLHAVSDSRKGGSPDGL